MYICIYIYDVQDKIKKVMDGKERNRKGRKWKKREIRGRERKERQWKGRKSKGSKAEKEANGIKGKGREGNIWEGAHTTDWWRANMLYY